MNGGHSQGWPKGVRVVGLTGGIASGKSTVSAILRELGAAIVDADAVAREVVEPKSEGLAQVALRFPGVVRPDGTLDRARLGERVFANEGERRALEGILHPRIQRRVREHVAVLARAGETLVVYDAPLIFENRLEEMLDGVILVDAPRDVQVARLIARDGLSSEQAEARIRAQLPLDEKRKRATWIVDNSHALESTRAQVEGLWHALREGRDLPDASKTR